NRSEADGVSAGLRLSSQVEADGQGDARAIIDDDLLGELLAELGVENARDRVGGAAGGLRPAGTDWLVRVLRRRASRECAGNEQQHQSKCAHAAALPMRF